MTWFGKVPGAAGEDQRIRGVPLAVLVWLAARANGTTGKTRSLTQADIAKGVGSHRVVVNRAIGKLIEAGYLEAGLRHGRGVAYRVLSTDVATLQTDLFAAVDDASRCNLPVTPKTSRGRNLPVSSDVTSKLPPKEQSLYQSASPAGSAQPRATPANDFADREEQKSAPGAVSGAVANARPKIDDLSRLLRDAAGESINTAHPGLLVLAEPLGWLSAGCDLELDILPTIAGIAARGGRPAQSWRYFAPAVLEARDRRVAAKEVRHLPPATSRPSRMKSVGEMLADAMARSARGEDPFPTEPDEGGRVEAKGRFTDVAARRREGGTGRFEGAFRKRREQMRQEAEDLAEGQSQWSTLELRANER